ncbi:MAG: ketopantoate reductase family protein [Candidatus Tectimicrobiota bacterium]
MKIVVLGAGALGSIITAYLRRAGEEVTLLARGARAESLRTAGLRICGVAEFQVPCTVVTEPRTLREADALILAVKAYDTLPALAGVQYLRVQSVCSVQNGLLKHEQLARTFGPEKTLGATCMFGGEVLPDGQVRYTLERELYLGALPGQETGPARDLVRTCQQAGLQAVYSEHIESIEWSKFVGWLGFTSIAVLTRLETYKFLCEPHTARMSARVMREAGQLATALGIPLEDRAPMASASVVQGSEEQAVAILQQLGETLRVQAPQMRQSALQDVERGRRIEVEETLGYALAKAAALGLELPTLDLCYGLLSGLNNSLR